MSKLVGVLGIVALGLTACATPYEIVEIPKREADLYPLSQTKEGITVAVDEITSTERSTQYFGVDLFKEGILPLNVVISNHTDRRLVINPADVLLLRGRQSVVDPVPLHVVTELVMRDYGWLKSDTNKRLDEHFEELTLQEIVLVPDQVYQGVLFFKAATPDRYKSRSRYFTVMSLYRQGALNLQISIADFETHERMHFGPFPISVH